MSAEEIKKGIESGKVVMGLKETIKNMKLGKISKVFLSNNCPESAKKDIETYSKMSEATFEVLDRSNEEMGIICKKPFSISVLSILK